VRAFQQRNEEKFRIQIGVKTRKEGEKERKSKDDKIIMPVTKGKMKMIHSCQYSYRREN
jgi:hypothetical protein